MSGKKSKSKPIPKETLKKLKKELDLSKFEESIEQFIKLKKPAK